MLGAYASSSFVVVAIPIQRPSCVFFCFSQLCSRVKATQTHLHTCFTPSFPSQQHCCQHRGSSMQHTLALSTSWHSLSGSRKCHQRAIKQSVSVPKTPPQQASGLIPQDIWLLWDTANFGCVFLPLSLSPFGRSSVRTNTRRETNTPVHLPVSTPTFTRWISDPRVTTMTGSVELLLS